MLEKELVATFCTSGVLQHLDFVGLVAMLFWFLKRSCKRLQKKFAETSDQTMLNSESPWGT
jgi:hypothetical protein